MCLLDKDTFISIAYYTRRGTRIDYATIGAASSTKYRLRFTGSPELERHYHNIESAISEATSQIIAAMLEPGSFIKNYEVVIIRVNAHGEIE